MDTYDPFKKYFGLNKNPELSGNGQGDFQSDPARFSTSILQQNDINRCSEKVNGFLVDYNESSPSGASVDQLDMHPVEAWLQRRSSTPIQNCNEQNFNGPIEGGHLEDFLHMESVREPLGDHIDTSNNIRSTSICDGLAEFVPEGRPLRGRQSRRTSQSSCSSEVSTENANVICYFEDLSNGAAHCDDRLSPAFFIDCSDSMPFMDYSVSPPLMPRPRSSFEMCCALYKRNGEYYTTHVVKDNRGKVICPILRKYVCPRRATGDNTHTLGHCPVANSTRSLDQKFQTRHNSSGRKRLF